MAANVETMFSVREIPWHGLGTIVAEAPESEAALKLAGLDWRVVQQPVYTENGSLVRGFKANIRETDNKVLGLVSNKYSLVQNTEAFSFTDSLLGEGVKYETAGSLQGGRKVWLLARMPEKYKICGDDVETYLVFSNAHDGSGAVRIAITPIRVVCNNTLNLALQTAQRSCSIVHMGKMENKIQEAHQALLAAEEYMSELEKEAGILTNIEVTDKQIDEYIKLLIPIKEDNMQHIRNIMQLRSDLRLRYYDAPDLKDLGKNAYRFINAVSDFALHNKPLRKTSSYNETRFSKAVDGNPLIDKAYQIVKAA